MPKYEVEATLSEMYTICEIEAENEQEARRKFLDGECTSLGGPYELVFSVPRIESVIEPCEQS